jgi:hypothetical protein
MSLFPLKLKLDKDEVNTVLGNRYLCLFYAFFIAFFYVVLESIDTLS